MSTKVISSNGHLACPVIHDIACLREKSCKSPITYKLHESNRYDCTKPIRVAFSVGKERQTLSFDLDENYCILLNRDQSQRCIDLLRALYMPTECYIDGDGHIQYSYEHEQLMDVLWDKGIITEIQREIAPLTPEARLSQSLLQKGCRLGNDGKAIDDEGIPF